MSFKNLFTFKNSLFSTFTLNQAKRIVVYVAVLFQADEEANEREQRELDALGAAASAGIGVGVAPTRCAVRDGSRWCLCEFPVGKEPGPLSGPGGLSSARSSGAVDPCPSRDPTSSQAGPQQRLGFPPIPTPRGSGVSYYRPLPSFLP